MKMCSMSAKLIIAVITCYRLSFSAAFLVTSNVRSPGYAKGGWRQPSPSVAGATANAAQSRRTSAPPRTSGFSTAEKSTTVIRKAVIQDLSVVGLVAGQENYGLAVVCLGEAIWSLLQAPSLSYAVRLLVPSGIAAVILFFVSGPMIQSGNADSVGLGLGIATIVSVGLGANYVQRLSAPYSPSPKEIAALGFLLSVAGFVSFAQNLLVDGFITLPSIDLGL